MLIRKLQNLHSYTLHNADESQSNPNPTPESQQGQQNGGNDGDKKKPAEIVLTSGQLKKRLEDEKAKARKELLAELEAENVESAKELISRQKAKDANEKSQSDKLADEIATLRQSLESEKTQRIEIEKKSRAEKRDSELKTLLNQAHDPNEVLVLLKAAHGDKVEALLDESGAFKKAEAENLIADYRKDKGHLFKDTRLGSAISNRDGRNPEPNKDAKEAAKKRMFQNARNSV